MATNIVDTNRILRDLPIQTKEDLDNYLRVFFDVYLARIPLMPGNSSPLDFVWDVYRTCINKGAGKNPHYNILAMAARGSQKTLSMAIIETLLLIHDENRDVFHMASIYDQSLVAYKYVKDFFKNPFLRETLADDPRRGLTENRFGRVLQIGTGTMQSVNSFHGSVFQDEIDLTDPVVFKESKGMLSAFKGHLPMNVCISSRKFAFGNVQKLLDNSKEEDSDLIIHKWGILEITQKCSSERSGTGKVPLYVNENELIAITDPQYRELPKDDRANYVQHLGYENCHKCGIFSFCQGHLKRQVDDNPFLQPIELTRSLFKNDAVEFFKSQRLNMKPSTIGLVYPQWSDDIHRKSHNELWEVVTNEKLPEGIYKDKEDVIRLLVNIGASLTIALDFGFHNAHALLIAFDKRDRVFVLDEIVVHVKTDLEFILTIKEKWGDLPIETCYPDIADPGAIKILRQELAFHVTSKIIKDRDEGYNTVRNLLRIPGTMESRCWTASDCTIFAEQMSLLHMKVNKTTDEPTEVVAKENDHGPDCFRYACHSRFAVTKGSLFTPHTGKLISNRVGYDSKNPIVAPSAQQLANQTGHSNFSDNRGTIKNKSRKKKIFY